MFAPHIAHTTTPAARVSNELYGIYTAAVAAGIKWWRTLELNGVCCAVPLLCNSADFYLEM